jgi:hypothetical protein
MLVWSRYFKHNNAHHKPWPEPTVPWLCDAVFLRLHRHATLFIQFGYMYHQASVVGARCAVLRRTAPQRQICLSYSSTNIESSNQFYSWFASAICIKCGWDDTDASNSLNQFQFILFYICNLVDKLDRSNHPSGLQGAAEFPSMRSGSWCRRQRSASVDKHLHWAFVGILELSIALQKKLEMVSGYRCCLSTLAILGWWITIFRYITNICHYIILQYSQSNVDQSFLPSASFVKTKIH